jgi:serine phosphatase RsbU (regulator of sigma subunit)
MVRILLVAAALAAGFWIARRAARASGATRALATFAAAALANHGLAEAMKLDWLHAARPLLVASGAAAGLIAWFALAWLVHLHPRRRDPFFRIPLFGIAVITGFAGAPWGVAAGFTCAAILCFRWKDQLPTGALFRLGLGAVLLSVLLLLRLPGPAPEFAEGGALAGLRQFARWSEFISVFYAIAGVVAMFAAFVRDPTLGIRQVGRRLALSHLLVVLVPLGLTLLLWAVTTIVGVGSERARVTARALEAEGEALARDAAVALQAGEGGEEALRRAVRARPWAGDGTRAWWIRDGVTERVMGEPMNGDSLLVGWFAAADTVPRAGLLAFAGRTWIAAVAGDSSRGAAALMPVQPVADRIGTHFIGGRVRVIGRLDDDLELFQGDPRPRDSTGFRRSMTITLPGDTIRTESFSADTAQGGFFPLGQAVSDGAALRLAGWRSAPFVVAITLNPRVVLGELFSRARTSQLDLVPLFLVLFFGGLFALVALFDMVMVINMGRSITAAIDALRLGATRLEAGDLAHRIPVSGNDELWDVARAFNQATGGLERARELEKERDRLESELELARRIQSRLLPAMAPEVEHWDIAGASESALQVGGDYYDHLDLGGGRLALVIADVSGKGVPAALLMSAFRAALMSQDFTGAEPSALAGRLNGFLHGSVEPGRFVTAFVAFLDTASGRLAYVNAGHNPPYVLRADGREEELSEGGTILGILPGSAFAAGQTTLGPGDLLALYTDGVTEGADASGDMWGEARLLESLRDLRGRPAQEIVRAIVDQVRTFEGATGPADDITLLIARRSALLAD